MKKTEQYSFGKEYFSRNWHPLAIGILIGFVLRELLIFLLLLAGVLVVVWWAMHPRNKSEKVKQ